MHVQYPDFLNAYAERAVKKTIDKLGLQSYTLGKVEKLKGVATAPLLVTVDDIKFVVKVHPEIVPKEIQALNYLYKVVPGLIPRILYADIQKGILVMPYYPWPTLHEIICNDFPTNVKIKTFSMCYSSLINVVYEATITPGYTDPHEAHISRIIERLTDWTNSGEVITIGNVILTPAELLKKTVFINGVEIGRAINLISEVDAKAHTFVCPLKTGTHGDPILPNFLCKPEPPYRHKIIDWPNFSISDPAKDLGKVFHWNHVYATLYEWWIENKEENEIISKLSVEVIKTPTNIEIYYDRSHFPRFELIREIDETVIHLFKNFTERHNDQNGLLRVGLGKVRADIGSVGIKQPYSVYKLILFSEGLLTLHNLMEVIKNGGDEDACLSIYVLDRN